jgi:Phosphodiester glycosidase
LGSCSTRPSPTPDRTPIAAGIDYQTLEGAGVQLLDIDLTLANVQPIVVAEGVARIGGNHVGDAYTVAEWAERYRAIGGVNGGFFGQTYDSLGARRQIVQLAVVDGAVVAPGGAVGSTRTPGERYLRSAIGFTGDGAPRMAWAAATASLGPRDAGAPTNPTDPRPWDVRWAVACGPRLIHRGHRYIADRIERLRSPERLPRTVVAYDSDGTMPRHLLLLRADAMTYEDLAAFVQRYFPAHHGTRAAEAMCLDGGASSQIVYRQGNRLIDAAPTGVKVPTALLLVPKKEGTPP